ncbi:unnamed protein product, partial [Larinioides sclopetarius]
MSKEKQYNGTKGTEWILGYFCFQQNVFIRLFKFKFGTSCII